MNYKTLPESLRATADLVATYLKVQMGVRGIKAEISIHPSLDRSTLHGVSNVHEYVCVEVSEEGCYPPSLSRMVEEMKSTQLPIRLYVAIPADSAGPRLEKDIRHARSQGVGVMSVAEHGVVNILADPIPLIHSYVRRIEMAKFPQRFRSDLHTAQQTYLNGNPTKGCLEIHEIIEEVSRSIVAKLVAKGLLSPPPSPRDITKGTWATLLTNVFKRLDFSRIPELKQEFWGNLMGVPAIRNEGAHRPKNVQERAERDQHLRTRFEHAVDLLATAIKTERQL
jgi:hypothetical protein